MTASVSCERSARTWRVRAWIRVGAALGFLAMTLEQVDVVRRVRAGQVPATEVREGYWLLAVLAVALWVLAFRPRVVLTPDGELLVRNPLTAHRLRAEDVVDVSTNAWGLLLHLRDGTRRWSIVFQDTASFGEPRWFDVAEALTGRRPVTFLDPDED